MSKDVPEREIWVMAGLALYPPSICRSLLSDHSFRKEYNITTDAVFIFGGGDIGFKRSHLLSVIRDAFSNQKILHTVNDEKGNEWKLMYEEIKSDVCITLSRDEQSYFLKAFWPLMPNNEDRLLKLEEVAKEHRLSNKSREYWENNIAKGPLSDDDLGELQEDLDDTVYHVFEKLKNEMKSGSSSLHSLVPKNIRYYERLVGQHINSNNIIEYSANESESHFHEIFLNGNYIGLNTALLMASQSSVAESLEKIEFDDGELKKQYDWLASYGDPISRTGAIEIGLSLLEKYPFLEAEVENLARQILNDKVEGIYNLLSSIIILVDGELARLQIFKDKPPFYRRLASIAHASLVTRCAIEMNIEFNSISEWAKEQRMMPFYCQTLVDLRFEPRWLPDYLSPEQLKAEMIGRISNAAHKNVSKIKSDTLKKFLLDEAEGNIRASIEIQSFLPGPLEGNILPNEMPSEITETVEETLSSDKQTSNTFIALINAVQHWKLKPQYTQQVLEMLSDAGHQLNQIHDKDTIMYILTGLSRVAAVTRNTALAEEVCILARKYRNYLNVNSQPEQIMVIGFVAAAAYDDEEKWIKYIGEWMTELAYLPLTNDSATRTYNWLKQFCLVEPILRCSCGRAIAALEAITTS